MSPIEAAARSIDQHNVVAEHNLALLQNGGQAKWCLNV
jgi:phage portal protein BeeE